MDYVNKPVLDRDHLSTMTGGDVDLAAEVLGLFQEQASMWSRLLDPRKPRSVWTDAAHSLKGSALSVGAMRLADACKETEDLGRGDSEVSVTRAAVSIDAIRTEMSKALDAASKMAHEIAVSGSFIASKEPNS